MCLNQRVINLLSPIMDYSISSVVEWMQ